MASSKDTPRRGRNGGVAAPTVSQTAFESWVRRAFFSHGGWLAGRYGLAPEDLLSQVAASPMVPALGVPRRAEGIEDLLLATGCCRNHPQAWFDAVELFEPLLVRASRMRLAEPDAIVFSRRFWSSLRERTVERSSGRASTEGPAMQDYPPNRPLRNWLVDRLAGSVESAFRVGLLPGGRRLEIDPTDRFGGPLHLVGS